MTDEAPDSDIGVAAHLVVLVEQFWHRQPGGTAVATEQTLDALSELGHFRITGLAARHSPPDREGGERWQRMPAGSNLRFLRLPRPVLYDSWLRFGKPSIDGETETNSVVWASSMIVPPTTRPVVATVHDLDFLHHPDRSTRRGRQFFPLAWERTVERASLVVCPSQAVAQDCVDQGLDAERIRVVPWGVSAPQVNPAEANQILESLRIDPGYVLWVGPLSARKNAARAAQALKPLGLPVVAVVSGDGDPGESAPWDDLGERVRRIDRVDSKTLSALYRGARALLYPSLAEGFGLPILEAMIHGTPVVTSQGGATGEIADGAALLVDPFEVSEMTDALAAAAYDHELRRRLSADGLVRAAQLSWKSTAAGYTEIFRSVE